MKAEESKLTSVFADNKTYEIPRYQRPYSWTTQNTEELINDIYDAYIDEEKEYFIGSIITIETEKDRKYDVVDGQQRLTTITILLAKLRDLITDPAVKHDLQQRILPIDVYTKEPESPRLIVRQQDRNFFRDHILMSKKREDKTGLTEPQRNFINNSETLEEFLSPKSEKELCLLAKYLLNNVYIVYVKTESFQSAYRLFNVLNARGLPLSNADLIKNKLFELTQDERSQDELEEKWNEFEEEITLSQIDVFLSHHRTSLTGNKQKNSLHKEFETYLNQYQHGSIQFLSELVSSAQNYNKIKRNDFNDPAVKRVVASLRQVSYDEWMPALLCFLNNKVEGLTLLRFVSYLEKITYQNWVRRLGKTKRNTVYYNIINLINEGASGESIINKIKEYRNNEEFLSFISSDVYGTQYAASVLLRIEQEMQDLSVTKSYSGIISVEHVLPQTMSLPYWQERFTTEDHKKYIHKIGNLALLSGKKNSSARNYDFNKKKEVYNKRNSMVSFDITKEICLLPDWTKTVVEERQDKLVKKAAEIWSIN